MKDSTSTADQALINQQERNEIGFGTDEILNPDDPTSVINLVPEMVRKAILAVPEYMWMLTAKEAEREYDKGLTNVDRLLRHSFWLEYDLAQKQKRLMVMENICHGVCSRSMFDKFVTKTPHRLAYMLKPPENYRVNLEEILEMGVRSLREIIDAPLHYSDKYGNKLTDAKLAAVKLKTVEMIMNRLQGMPVSRSMQVTENVNRNYNHQSSGDSRVPDFSQFKDMDKLKKLVEQMEEGAKEGEVLEVGFTDEQDQG